MWKCHPLRLRILFTMVLKFSNRKSFPSLQKKAPHKLPPLFLITHKTIPKPPNRITIISLHIIIIASNFNQSAASAPQKQKQLSQHSPRAVASTKQTKNSRIQQQNFTPPSCTSLVYYNQRATVPTHLKQHRLTWVLFEGRPITWVGAFVSFLGREWEGGGGAKLLIKIMETVYYDNANMVVDFADICVVFFVGLLI